MLVVVRDRQHQGSPTRHGGPQQVGNFSEQLWGNSPERGQARSHELPESTVAQWIAQAQRGDGRAREDLYRWLAPAVVGYLRVQEARNVEDLTSEVFLALVKAIGQFNGGGAALRSFVFVIAHLRLQDQQRQMVRHPEQAALDVAGAIVGGTLDEDAFGWLDTERVRALCDRLAADQRDVILLRIVADLTVEQVADVVGKTKGAVKVLQRRGFEQLRRILLAEAVPL